VAKKDYPSERIIQGYHIQNPRIIITFFLGLVYSLIPWMFLSRSHNIQILILIYIPAVTAIYYSLQTSFLRIEKNLNQPILLSQEIDHFIQTLDKTTNKTNFVRHIQKFFSDTLHIEEFAFYEVTDDIQPFKLLWYENIPFEKLKKIDLLAQELFSVIKNKAQETLINISDCPDELKDFLKDAGIQYILPLIYQENVIGVIFLNKIEDKNSVGLDVRGWNLLAHQIAPRLAMVNSIDREVEVQKMAELGVMASQIAHDFKSFLTLIKMSMPSDEMIDRQVSYMSKLVKDISDYARVRTSEKVLTDIHGIIDASLESVQIPDHVIVEKNYSKDIPQTMVDPIQIQRVFINLIENSIRAMPDGGKIRINTRLIKSIASAGKKWIYIEFMDEGKGIPEKDLAHIFEPFFTTYKKKGGTGMGLAIARQIIKRHKGFIDVTSKEGKGTILNIRLPIITNNSERVP
jgi:signal transduction histidine kinase